MGLFLVDRPWETFDIGWSDKNHHWGQWTYSSIAESWFSICKNCGTKIWGSAGHKPTTYDLKFQMILQDCKSQLVRNIMEV